MGKRAGLLAGSLVLTLGVGVAAQAPSPPPWLGGRVEMPEQGFAVTLPDDWVALDTSVDGLDQVEAISDFLDPVWWSSDDDPWWAGDFATLAPKGIRLAAAHATSDEYCQVGVYPTSMSLAEVALDYLGDALENPLSRDIERPRTIELPAGTAYVIRQSKGDDDGDEDWWPASSYLLRMDGGVLWLGCDRRGVRPEDDWLSVAETIELLPTRESSPPPWLGGRVEMPEHGFAIMLPDDWVGFDTSTDILHQIEVGLDVLDPAMWSTDVAGWVDGFVRLVSRDIPLWLAHATSNGWCEVGPSPLDMSFTDAAAYNFEWYSGDADTRDVDTRLIDLPSGTAHRIQMSRRSGSESDEWWPATHYLLGTEGPLMDVYCRTYHTRPDDDWLSIVETFEFVTAEE